jgi:chromosome segregation ATPase
LLSAYYALKNIRTNNIINARLDWGKNLKELIAEFVTVGFSLVKIDKEISALKIPALDPKPDQVEKLNEDFRIHFEKYEEQKNKLIKTKSLLHLNLNSNEDLHKNLETQLNRFSEIIDKIQEQLELLGNNLRKSYLAYKEGNFENEKEKLQEEQQRIELQILELENKLYLVSDSVINLSKSILKIEWEITKAGRITTKSKKELREIEINSLLKNLPK